MPNLAANHPQVVHFAIVLLLVGVAFRVIALTGKLAFTHHAATALLLLGTIAAAVSVKSGTDAHGPVERIPGVRTAVQVHEDYGIRTRNIFFGVAALELIGLGLAGVAGASLKRYAKFAFIASAGVGIWGSFELYEAGEHGGELVYSYGGGPGLRTGDTADVERMLIAGLYNQSVADRKAGRNAEAARLIYEMMLRAPQDTTVQLLHVESLLVDLKDYQGALFAGRALSIDTTNARLMARKATLLADVFIAMGFPDSARAVLTPVVTAFPQNTRLQAKLDSLR